MEDIIAALKKDHKIFAPKRFPGGVIRYGEIESLSEIVVYEKSHFSPKEIYFPIVQTLLYFKGRECKESEADDEKIIIFARACDINAARRLDNIFLRNGGDEDNYYKRLREKVKFILIECEESFSSCFCVSMGTNCTENYMGILRAGDVDMAASPRFVTENAKKVNIPEIDNSLVGGITKLTYWKKFDDKCVSCGGCSAVCPTCSCFDTVDVIYNETSPDGERRRFWGSCMREDFTTMAGGHSVRKTPGDRMRFRTMHKIYDFKERFGDTHMCVGCGRCEDRCPEGLVFSDTINGLSAELAKGGEAE